MKRVFLYAYDKMNLGDDLFIHTITKRYPNVQFYIRTDVRNKTALRQLDNLKVLDKNARIPQLLGRIRGSLAARYVQYWERRCCASVYIGGSIYMEYDTSPGFLEWLEFQAENQNFFSLGANFGPYRTKTYHQRLGQIFEKMRDVCFRDRWSCEQFPNCSRVRYAPDILFCHPMKKMPVRFNQVFVSVINCEGKDQNAGLSAMDGPYTANMARILKGYLDAGCTLVMASFCKAEGDETAIRRILSAMNCVDDPRITILSYDGTNAQTVTDAISQSAYVIASRFHATILALAAGRPVLPLIYSDKTMNVLKDLAFEGTLFDIRENAVWDYTESRRNWDQPTPVLSDTIKVAASDHFRELDKLLAD